MSEILSISKRKEKKIILEVLYSIVEKNQSTTLRIFNVIRNELIINVKSLYVGYSM